MSFLNKLSGLILPKEVDFFGNLQRQSLVTQQVVDSIYHIYIEDGKTGGNLSDVLHNANDMRIKNLLELGEVLITPVDKEAISRTYIQLDWIVLSIKHLDVEISAYKISSLLEYQKIFRLLQKQMEKMSNCFQLLTIKKYKEVFISLGGVLSKVYRTEVSLEEYLVYTTEEREKMQVQAYAAKYGGIQEGIKILASEWREKIK